MVTAVVALVLAAAAPVHAETTVTPVDPAPPDQAPVVLAANELDTLVAPIALYPDDLIAIVLPASTYPLQVVQAARFLDQVKTESTLKPDDTWDDSVVALTNYPEVVELMNNDLDWTWKLGQAVINQQGDVLEAVETFRRRATAAGNFKSDDRQVVTVTPEVVEVKPADPKVMYVPYYEPAQVTVYQRYPVYHYYPAAYPVYYYPYPDDYVFRWPYFWGVTTFYSLGWSTHHVHVHHHHDHGHPYYAHRYGWHRHYYHRPHYAWHDRRNGNRHDDWKRDHGNRNDWKGRYGGNDWRHDWRRGGARPGDWHRNDRDGDRGSWSRRRNDGMQASLVGAPTQRANATTPIRTRWDSDRARAARNVDRNERGARQMNPQLRKPAAQTTTANTPRTRSAEQANRGGGWQRSAPVTSARREHVPQAPRARTEQHQSRRQIGQVQPNEIRNVPQRVQRELRARPEQSFQPQRRQSAQIRQAPQRRQSAQIHQAPQHRPPAQAHQAPQRRPPAQAHQAPRVQQRSAPPQRVERQRNGGRQAQAVVAREQGGGGNRGNRGRGWQSR